MSEAKPKDYLITLVSANSKLAEVRFMQLQAMLNARTLPLSGYTAEDDPASPYVFQDDLRRRLEVAGAQLDQTLMEFRQLIDLLVKEDDG